MTSTALLAFAALNAQDSSRRKRQLRDFLLLLRIRATLRGRHYLTSGALQQPQDGGWYKLYMCGSDANLINQIGIERSAFDELISVFARHYAVSSGFGRPGRPHRIHDKHAVLGLLLSYYCGTQEMKTICIQFGVPPATASRTLHKAELALQQALQELPDASIRWPTHQEQAMWAEWVAKREPLVVKKFAFIDGKNYRVLAPTAVEAQNAMYNGWLHATLVTGTICFGADGCIIWGKHNCPGSWNDGETSRRFRELLLDATYTLHDHGVLSDSAFPVSGALYDKIVTPLKKGDLDRALRNGSASEARLIAVNNAVISIRQAAEWGMGAVEKVYRRLLLPLSFDPHIRQRRMGNIHRLYNFRVRRTQISQIRNVFSLKQLYD